MSRTAGLRAEEADGSVVLFGEQDELVLRLNRAAAAVWRNSDGTRTVGNLVDVLTEELGEQADRDQVLVALDELARHGLIESGYEQRDPTASRVSRRQFVRRVGGAVAAVAVGMPIVHSMLVPEQAEGAALGHHYMYCPNPKLLKDKKPPKQWKPPYTSNCGPKR